MVKLNILVNSVVSENSWVVIEALVISEILFDFKLRRGTVDVVFILR